MREIYRYKSKNILYSTGTYEEEEEDRKKREAAEAAQRAATAAQAPAAAEADSSGLTPEQLAIVNASKSDNRISDSVADIVAHNV